MEWISDRTPLSSRFPMPQPRSLSAGLIGWLIADGRRQRAALADLEARGVRRRSSQPQLVRRDRS